VGCFTGCSAEIYASDLKSSETPLEEGQGFRDWENWKPDKQLSYPQTHSSYCGGGGHIPLSADISFQSLILPSQQTLCDALHSPGFPPPELRSLAFTSLWLKHYSPSTLQATSHFALFLLGYFPFLCHHKQHVGVS